MPHVVSIRTGCYAAGVGPCSGRPLLTSSPGDLGQRIQMSVRLRGARSPGDPRLRRWSHARIAAVALLLALAVGPPLVEPQPSSGEVAALLLIKQVLDPLGTVLSAWRPGRGAPCNWPGIFCDDSNRVRAIDIWERTIPGVRLSGRLPGAVLLRRLPALTYIGLVETGGLTGTLPADWSQVPQLQAIFLMGNSLTGPLPSEWGALVKVRVIKLQMNRLSGPLPGSWSRMVDLKELVLGINTLTGPLPPSWGALTSLERLTLFRNKLSGQLPASWSGMTSITQFYLDTNNLRGPVPVAWGDWPSIDNVTLYDNPGLSGCLPAAWQGTVNTRYKENDVADVLTTGTGIKGFCGSEDGSTTTTARPLVLPGAGAAEGTSDEVAALLAIKRLIDPPGTALTDWQPGAGAPCRWTGVVCEEGAPQVKWLFFWSYTDQQPLVKLTGKLPSGALLRRLPLLVTISFDETGVGGTLPADWGQLTQLGSVYLSSNALEGTLPASWSGMAGLETLRMFENKFTGPLPDSWSRMAALEELSLYNNPGLEGPVPTSWSRLSNLQQLYLWNAGLSGPLPPSWSTLKKLKELYLWGNSLNGPLPSTWSGMSSLVELDISRNSITASLPPTWSALSKVKKVLLYGNALTGALPATWSQLTALEGLYLDSNTLTGSVPPAWGTWPRIVNVTLHNNPGLEGCLPRAWRGKVNKNNFEEGVTDVLTTKTGITGFC